MGGYDVIVEHPTKPVRTFTVGTLEEAKKLAQDYVIKTAATRAVIQTTAGVHVVTFIKREEE